MSRCRFVLVLVAVVFTSLRAEGSLTYTDFSSTAGLQLNGNAIQSGNRLRLTSASGFQSGSAFTTSSTSLGNLNSFSTFFQFQITASGGISDEDGTGADGLVFVVQTVSNSVGGAGGGIGYQGISPSLGIEFDTWNNGPTAGEPNGNHVGVDLNGSVLSSVVVTEPVRFNNGQVWNVWIDYNGNTDGLEVRWSMSSTRPTAAQLSATVDLVALLNQNTAFLGFTSGTGSAWGNHDILSWTYRDSFNPIGVNSVPEPSSLALMTVGALSVLGYGWRIRVRRNA